MNSELILVFGGHKKSLENLLLSTSKLIVAGAGLEHATSRL